MDRSQSILTIKGHTKSYVPVEQVINELVKRVRISDNNVIHKSEDGTEQSVHDVLNSKGDATTTGNPIDYTYAFETPLEVGDVLPQEIDVSIVDDQVYHFLDTNSGKVYTIAYSDEAGDFIATEVNDADLNAVYYYGPQRTYYKIVAVNNVDSTTYQCAVVATAVARVEPLISAGPSVSIVLDPSKYNVIDKINTLTITGSNDGDQVPYNTGLTPVVGRFIANINNVTISLPPNIAVCENNPDIEANHTYEYNIFDGVFNLIDVTTTA